MKNKLYSNAEFQESLDRSLSSLQPDRLMARRIIASGKEEEKVKKIPRLAIVIAVLLILTMATAIAAHIAGWTKGLEELLQVTEEQKEKHQDTGLFDEPGLSATKDGVTVTLDQCVVVPQAAYIAFRVKGYPLQPGEEPGFDLVSCEAAHAETFIDNYSSFFNGLAAVPDGEPYNSYTNGNGDLLYVFTAAPSDEQVSLIGLDLKVVLGGLGIYEGKAGDVNRQVEGPWEFEWTLKGTDQQADVTGLHEPIGKDGCFLKEVHLTPVSIELRMLVPKKLNEHSAMDDAVPFFAGVIYKDGTELTEMGAGGREGYEDGLDPENDAYGQILTLDRLIEPEKVESLIFYWNPDWGNDELEDTGEPERIEVKIRK